MARGSKNQPKKGCWPRGTECNIVLYEQSKHRKTSKGNAFGFCGGTAGRTWQSHHILCITSMGNRQGKTPKATQELNDSLYITDWNINDDPNMIGMPQKANYQAAYGKIEKTRPVSAQAALWVPATNSQGTLPANIPAHNVDHNTTGGYTKEVIGYLKSNVWNKFNSQGADHKKDAAWLANELNEAAKEHQRLLLQVRGIRKGGTVPAWQNRIKDKNWAQPFSMAVSPSQRYWGSKTYGGALSRLFTRL